MGFSFPLYFPCLCCSIILQKAYLESLWDAGECQYLKCTHLKIKMDACGKSWGKLVSDLEIESTF